MSDDERQIRELVDRWMTASKAGDTDTVLSLMTEDVAFYLPGRAPMRGRAEFAAASAAGRGKFRVEGTADVLEVGVSGALAYAIVQLAVEMHFPDGTPPVRRTGHALSIYRKQPDGRWLLARDANMLAVEQPAKGSA